MSYSYQLHERAQQDYEEALQWYVQRSQRAAENSVMAVDNALKLICGHPHTGAINTSIIMNWD